MSPEERGLVCGIDGGGTKTVCLIATREGKILGKGVGGASTYHHVPDKEMTRNIRHAITEARKNSGVPVGRFQTACVGLAGIDRPSDRKTAKGLLKRTVPAGEFVLRHDAEIALIGGTLKSFGVVVISGTGSVAFGINPRGKTARSGGWGYLLGDEGSAYDIGRQALLACCKCSDCRGRRTRLVGDFLAHFKVRKWEDMVAVAYRLNRLNREKTAALASLVTQAARRGDRIARAILNGAGKELGEAALSVIRKLGMVNRNFDVVCVGGVFSSGAFVLRSLASKVKMTAHRARITRPLMEPAAGAVIEALRTSGVMVDDSVISRLRLSLGRQQEVQFEIG